MAKKFLTPITPPALSSDPATGTAGSIYYNTSTNTLKYYNGTSWSEIGGLSTTNTYANSPSNGTLIYNTATNRMAVSYDNIWKEIAYKSEIDTVDGGDSDETYYDLVLDGGGSTTGTFVNSYYP